MKKLLSSLLALLLCFAAVGCSACSEPESEMRRLEFVNSETYRLLDGEGNPVRTYRRASYAYLPRHMLREAWAVCNYTAANGKENTQYFYATEEASAENFLVLADPNDYYPYFMIVADGYTLPTLAEMKPNEAVICSTAEDLFWQAANVLDYVYLQDNVDALVSAFTLAGETSLPESEPVAAAEVIFSSAEWKEISFYCTAYLYADGSAYLHDSATGRTAPVSEDLLKQYYPFKDVA